MCKWDTETGECLGRAAISRNLVGSAVPSSVSLPTWLFHTWGCAERICWELGAEGSPGDTVHLGRLSSRLVTLLQVTNQGVQRYQGIHGNLSMLLELFGSTQSYGITEVGKDL